jgi:hypothetical protein
MGYYLTDVIYLFWMVFMKGVPLPQEKETLILLMKVDITEERC